MFFTKKQADIGQNTEDYSKKGPISKTFTCIWHKRNYLPPKPQL